MTMWFHFGSIGLVILFGYIGSTIKFLMKEKNRVLLASFAALLIDMGGNYPLEIATTAFLAIIICGLIERQRLVWEII